MTWTRQGPLSGPANVLDNRYRVVKTAKAWVIEDMRTGFVYRGPHARRGYWTMRAAKAEAEALAASAS